MTKKTETVDAFFTFPPIRAKLVTMADTDANHFPVDGEDILVWMPYFRDPEYRGFGERWLSQNGTRPRNTSPEAYAKNASRYSNSFEFHAYSMCTESMIVGNLHTESEAGRAYLDQLYAADAIRKIGKVESSGDWNNYTFTLDGIDLIFGVTSVVEKNTVHPLNDKGYAAAIPPGPIFMACDSLSLTRCSPSSIPAGMLIPEVCTSGGAASLIEQGRIVPAGSLADEFSDVELLPAVADVFRNIAVVDADGRARGGEKRTDEQEKYIAEKFRAAIEAAGGAK